MSDLFVPLFDSEYFDRIIRSNKAPLPYWETARAEIGSVFAQLHSELIFRVNEHMKFALPFHLEPPRQFTAEPDHFFEKRSHFSFNRYYLDVCCQLECAIEKMRNTGEIRKYKCRLFPLVSEIERLRSVLIAIAHIIHPLQSQKVHSLPVARLVSLTDDDGNNVNHRKAERPSSSSSSDSSRKSLKLTQQKIVLELKKDRVKPHVISTSDSSGRSSPVESKLYWADDEAEKKDEFISTDEEDFEAYTQEIHKMTTNSSSTSGYASRSSSFASSSLPPITPPASVTSSCNVDDEITAIIKEMNLGIAADVFTFLGQLGY